MSVVFDPFSGRLSGMRSERAGQRAGTPVADDIGHQLHRLALAQQRLGDTEAPLGEVAARRHADRFPECCRKACARHARSRRELLQRPGARRLRVHGVDGFRESGFCESGQQTDLQALLVHQVAQHLNEHHFDEAVEHRLPSAVERAGRDLRPLLERARLALAVDPVEREAAVAALEPVHLDLVGRQAIDGDTAQVGPGIAIHLDLPQLTYVRKVEEVDETRVLGERLLETGYEVVEVPTPCVLTVVKEINEPRYPSFMGIRKANRAQIPVWTAADLATDDALRALLMRSP